MKYNISKLDNNLRVLTILLPNFNSVTATVWVRTGSRNETDNVSGISHFLEHMAFKGGAKYKTSKDVSEAVDAIGGEFNASTSKEWTKYYIRVRSALLDKALDVLSDMLLYPKLRQADIDREKGVIVEEMNMYEDTPMSKIWDVYEQLIYKGHHLGRDIIGTKKTVKALSRADLKKYISDNYVTENMLVTIVGGVSESKSKALVSKYFKSLKSGNEVSTERFTFDQPEPKLLLNDKPNEQAHFIVGFPGNKLGHKTRYAETLLNVILGGGMSSRLFTEVREKRGLAYTVRSEADHYFDTGYFSAYAGVDPGKAEEAIKVILDQFYGLARGKYKITPVELKKAKEYIKGHVALSLEDTRAITAFVGHEYLMRGKTRTIEQEFKKLDKVTEGQIRDYAKSIFNPKLVNLAIIGPFKSKTKFDKIIN